MSSQKMRGFFLPYLLFLVVFSKTLCLYADQQYWLKRTSNIENPLGLWVIPQGSMENYSQTHLVLSSSNHIAQLYLTYSFLASDAPPSFVTYEHQAKVFNNEIETSRGKISIYIEDDQRERMISGQKRMTRCGVYNKKGGALLAYCALQSTGINFNLLNANNDLVSRFFSEQGKWQLSLHHEGVRNFYKTASLMLASKRLWRN